MPIAYQEGDEVITIAEVVRDRRTFPVGTRGRITADSPSILASARVKFPSDEERAFRVVPKIKLQPA